MQGKRVASLSQFARRSASHAGIHIGKFAAPVQHVKAPGREMKPGRLKQSKGSQVGSEQEAQQAQSRKFQVEMPVYPELPLL